MKREGRETCSPGLKSKGWTRCLIRRPGPTLGTRLMGWNQRNRRLTTFSTSVNYIYFPKGIPGRFQYDTQTVTIVFSLTHRLRPPVPSWSPHHLSSTLLKPSDLQTFSLYVPRFPRCPSFYSLTEIPSPKNLNSQTITLSRSTTVLGPTTVPSPSEFTLLPL